jgi:hypothetical protein
MNRSALGRAFAVASSLALAIALYRSRPGAPPARPEPVAPSGEPAPGASGPPGASRDVASAAETAAGGERPSPACRALAEHNRRALRTPAPAGGGGAGGDATGEEDAPEVRLAGEETLLRACFPGGDGPWALRVEAFRPEPYDPGMTRRAAGSVRVLHRANGGPGWVEAADAVGHVRLEAGLSYTRVEPPEAPDVDGDGEPELWLSIGEKEHEGGSTVLALFLRFRGGVVEPVPGLPENYQTLRDVDGDGRVDVVYHPYTGSGDDPCTGFGYQVAGPPFLAHARPDGTFSTDDDEAKRHARSLCPAGAAELPEAPDEDWADPVICARLRGESPRAALRLLDKHCRPPRPGENGCEPAPGVCSDYAMRAAWARQEPPLTLR